MTERREKLNLLILDYALRGKTFMPFHFGAIALLYAMPGMVVVIGWKDSRELLGDDPLWTASNKMTAVEAIEYLKDIPDDDLI